MSSLFAPEPLAVHVGQRRARPVPEGAVTRPQIADVVYASQTGHQRPIPLIVTENLDWESFGLAPRWVEEDTTEAVAALEPCMVARRGADEWDRFIAGARARDELALVVCMVGSLAEDYEANQSIFGPSATVNIPGRMSTSVGDGAR